MKAVTHHQTTGRARRAPLRASRSPWCRSVYSATSVCRATSSICRAPSRRSFSRSDRNSFRAMPSTSTAVYSRMSVSFLPPCRGSCRLLWTYKDTLSSYPSTTPSTTFEYTSGMVVRTALDRLADETFKVFEQVMLRITLGSGHTISFDVASRVASTIATGVMAPVYAQVDPESLGNDLRDLSVATAYGERLVEFGGNATHDTVRQLVEDYPTHEFIIDSQEAKKLFKIVKDPSEEMNRLTKELGEIAYSVQSPHVIMRADRHLEQEESDDNGNNRTDAERGAAACVG